MFRKKPFHFVKRRFLQNWRPEIMPVGAGRLVYNLLKFELKFSKFQINFCCPMRSNFFSDEPSYNKKTLNSRVFYILTK